MKDLEDLLGKQSRWLRHRPATPDASALFGIANDGKGRDPKEWEKAVAAIAKDANKTQRVSFGDACLAASAVHAGELVASFDRDLSGFPDVDVHVWHENA